MSFSHIQAGFALVVMIRGPTSTRCGKRLPIQEEYMKMFNLRWLAAPLLGAGLLITANVSAQESEMPVRMKDLPAAVRATVRQQSQGATVRGLSKEVEGGQTYYEVSLKVGGRNRDVLIDPAGAIVEVEEEVSLASLPPAVKAGIEKHAGRGKIVMVESKTKGGAIVLYEAHIKTGKKYSEVQVSPDGQLIKE
jgi:hypothetical protein